MKIVLISGKAQHGKDTVAKILREHLISDGKRVLVTHYGDLLKYICTQYFDWDGKKDERGRHLLQYIGTDVIRKKNPDLWVNFVAMILRYFHENWDYVIIPDCRFPNEITGLTDKGFDVVHVRVVRNDFTSALTAEQLKHPSETALDGVEPDHYIYNDGSLDDLDVLVTYFVKEVLYRNA